MPSDSSLISLARNPVPGGAVEGLISTPDGVKLRYATWLATREPLRGTCVVVQGRSEYIEKYFETVADLRRRGYAVLAFDLRGQGGSERLLRHALSEGSPLGRLVVTGAMIRLSDVALGVPARSARLLAEVGSAIGFGHSYVPGGTARPVGGEPFEGNPLTTDRERYMRAQAVLDAAPQLAIGAPTFGWMRAAFRSMAVLQAPDSPRNVNLPTLFVAAGDDKVVSTTAIEDFALKTKLGSAVLLAAARHEILQESDDTRTRFWSAFDAYLAVGEVAA